MSFLTTNPSQFILNLPSFQNVATSATGVNESAFVNTGDYSLKINTINSFNASFLTIQKNTNFSNATIYMNGTQTLTTNSLNGSDYIAFQINSQEKSRLTGTGFGIGTIAPTKPLHVVGDGFITGELQVGSIVYPSDTQLKENVQPFTVNRMPEPVSFTWKSNGQKDIGVLASDVLEIEPLCVKTNNGLMGVDYPKLVVLCLAELKSLREKVENLESTIAKLQAEHSVSQQQTL